jgi:hypothetical protein
MSMSLYAISAARFDVSGQITTNESNDDPIQYYVHIEETFDVVKRAHIATGHGGRDRMVKEYHAVTIAYR